MIKLRLVYDNLRFRTYGKYKYVVKLDKNKQPLLR